MTSTQNSIAIIGAGMAGLSCAQSLAAAGRTVRLFDKGRGPGGRMATRRAQVGGETLRFDHGAQYFNALDSAFAAQCEEWRSANVVSEWPAAGEGALVGTPGMNAIIRHMAEPLDVSWGARIERIDRLDNQSLWRLSSDTEAADFRGIVCATPAEQAAVLLEGAADTFATKAADVLSDPCWAVMASFDDALGIADDAVCHEEGPIAWAARNSAKPGRGGAESWVIHASKSRSLELLSEPKEDVAEQILRDFFKQARIEPAVPVHLTAHRWLYAFPQVEDGQSSLWDEALQVGACGDWLVAPNVEGAWLSGQHLAAQILQSGA